MGFITESQLRKHSTGELGALLIAFNAALLRARPFTSEWTDAAVSVESILRERSLRSASPRLRF